MRAGPTVCVSKPGLLEYTLAHWMPQSRRNAHEDDDTLVLLASDAGTCPLTPAAKCTGVSIKAELTWVAWHMQEDIEEMLKYCDKPLIFPLSNPSSKAEITAEKAYEYAHGKCVYASGTAPPLHTRSSIPAVRVIMMCPFPAQWCPKSHHADITVSSSWGGSYVGPLVFFSYSEKGIV